MQPLPERGRVKSHKNLFKGKKQLAEQWIQCNVNFVFFLKKKAYVQISMHISKYALEKALKNISQSSRIKWKKQLEKVHMAWSHFCFARVCVCTYRHVNIRTCGQTSLHFHLNYMHIFVGTERSLERYANISDNMSCLGRQVIQFMPCHMLPVIWAGSAL